MIFYIMNFLNWDSFGAQVAPPEPERKGLLRRLVGFVSSPAIAIPAAGDAGGANGAAAAGAGACGAEGDDEDEELDAGAAAPGAAAQNQERRRTLLSRLFSVRAARDD
jgi:hypothetical protein